MIKFFTHDDCVHATGKDNCYLAYLHNEPVKSPPWCGQFCAQFIKIDPAKPVERRRIAPKRPKEALAGGKTTILPREGS